MPAISNLCFVRAQHFDVADGLLGWARFEIGPLIVDGVAVRRTRAGHFALSYPKRHDRAGREHTIVIPSSLDGAKLIEQQVLRELRRRGEIR